MNSVFNAKKQTSVGDWRLAIPTEENSFLFLFFFLRNRSNASVSRFTSVLLWIEGKKKRNDGCAQFHSVDARNMLCANYEFIWIGTLSASINNSRWHNKRQLIEIANANHDLPTSIHSYRPAQKEKNNAPQCTMFQTTLWYRIESNRIDCTNPFGRTLPFNWNKLLSAIH